MKDPLKRLLNHVKMIFNCSTFFNDSVCVSALLVKITNQIIISCKRYITAGKTLDVMITLKLHSSLLFRRQVDYLESTN